MSDDHADGGDRVELDILLTQMLQPAGQKKQDEKKVNDNADAVDRQLDEKGKQRPASFGFHKGQGAVLGKLGQPDLTTAGPFVNDENDCTRLEIP